MLYLKLYMNIKDQEFCLNLPGMRREHPSTRFAKPGLSLFSGFLSTVPTVPSWGS